MLLLADKRTKQDKAEPVHSQPHTTYYTAYILYPKHPIRIACPLPYTSLPYTLVHPSLPYRLEPPMAAMTLSIAPEDRPDAMICTGLLVCSM